MSLSPLSHPRVACVYLLVIGAAGLASCSSVETTDPTFIPKPLSVSVDYEATQAPEQDPDVYESFIVTLVAMDGFPDTLGEALETRAQLIASTRSPDALRATSRLARRARMVDRGWSSAETSGFEASAFHQRRLVVGPGVFPVLTIDCQRAGSREVRGLDRLVLTLEPPEGERRRIRWRLRFEGVAALGAPDPLERASKVVDDQDGHEEVSALDFVKETVLLETPASTNGPSMGVILAGSFGDGSFEALWLSVESIEPDSQDVAAHQRAVAACQRTLLIKSRRPSEAVAEASSLTEGLDTEALIQGLSDVEARRPYLAYIAREHEASCAEDLSHTGSAEMLAKIAERIRENAEPIAGLRVERACLLALADRVASRTLPDELDAVLLSHVGELGRTPRELREVVKEARDLEDLRERIYRANIEFLDDSTPGARIRAFDWLEAQGLAPIGYDPLGERSDRRAALRKASEASDEGGEQS